MSIFVLNWKNFCKWLHLPNDIRALQQAPGLSENDAASIDHLPRLKSLKMRVRPALYPGIRQNIGRQRKRRRLKAKIIDCRQTAGFSGKKFTVTIKFVVMMMEPLMLLWRRRRSNRNYDICQWILTYRVSRFYCLFVGASFRDF